MPVDPNISLAAAPPDPGKLLGTIGQFANIQNAINQNRLFQQTFAARQKAGQILAGAPDMETGLQNLLKDPVTAPFAGETINSIRTSQQTLADIGRLQAVTAGERQHQNQTGMEAFYKSLGPILADPREEVYQNIVNANLATLSPSAREDLAPAFNSIHTALMVGLPTDPAQRRAAFNQRLAAFMSGGGITPESINSITGTPQLFKFGGYDQPGIMRPGTVGGGISFSGPPIGETAPPANVQGDFGLGGAPTVARLPGGLPSGSSLPLGTAPGVTPAGPPATPPPAGVTAPTASNSLGAVRPPSQPPLTGLTRQQQKYTDQRMDAMGKYEENLDDRVLTGGTFRRNMDEIISAAKEAQTGGGADAFMKMGQLLQAIGFNNVTVDKIANGSLKASQVIDKASLTNTMNQLKQQLTGIGGSRINQQEFVAQLSKNPNLATDPRAIVQVFNLWNDFYNRDVAEQKALDQYKNSGGDISRWPSQWMQSDFMKSFAPGTPITGEGVKGIGPAKPAGAGAGNAPSGYRLAPDGQYYKPDPSRPGKYLMWKP
jgi:hypothetical protein